MIRFSRVALLSLVLFAAFASACAGHKKVKTVVLTGQLVEVQQEEASVCCPFCGCSLVPRGEGAAGCDHQCQVLATSSESDRKSEAYSIVQQGCVTACDAKKAHEARPPVHKHKH